MPTTPYMSMLLPVVSSTLGPEWASELNDALDLIDAHDHSSGKGTPVRTAGIYLDADLDFRGTNSKNARSARFALQASLLGGVADVCSLYFSGADLYANDAAGNQIQITSGGGIVGTAGSISGLASPASVVYTPATKLFKFYSGSNVWASMQAGPLTISEAVLNGKGVTISVPVGLSANYGLELPAALPASTSLLTLSPIGVIAAPVTLNALTIVATSGAGVTATGNTSSPGVAATGGSSGAYGVTGTSAGSGYAGVRGYGAGSNGQGVRGTGGAGGVGGYFEAGSGRAAITLVPTAAPSGWNDGDMWVETGTNTLKVRINGSTRTVTLS